MITNIQVSVVTFEFNQRISTEKTPMKKQADSLIWRCLCKIRSFVLTEKNVFSHKDNGSGITTGQSAIAIIYWFIRRALEWWQTRLVLDSILHFPKCVLMASVPQLNYIPLFNELIRQPQGHTRAPSERRRARRRAQRPETQAWSEEEREAASHT